MSRIKRDGRVEHGHFSRKGEDGCRQAEAFSFLIPETADIPPALEKGSPLRGFGRKYDNDYALLSESMQRSAGHEPDGLRNSR